MKKYPEIKTRIEFDIENNPYDTIYVDLTYRCNMTCQFCYNPIRTLPDLDLNYFEDVCKKLPNKVLFRLLGGEPTLHKQFFEFIKIAHQYNHLVSIVTNGLKFNNKQFVSDFKLL